MKCTELVEDDASDSFHWFDGSGEKNRRPEVGIVYSVTKETATLMSHTKYFWKYAYQ